VRNTNDNTTAAELEFNLMQNAKGSEDAANGAARRIARVSRRAVQTRFL
jgi:hypothetical protein